MKLEEKGNYKIDESEGENNNENYREKKQS